MPKVGLRAYNPVEVEFTGKLFESVDLPDSKQEQLAKVMNGLDGLDEDSPSEEGKALVLEWFDLMLEPVEHSQKPSTVLKKGLKDESITPRQMTALWIDTLTAIGKANTPEDAPEGSDPTRPT